MYLIIGVLTMALHKIDFSNFTAESRRALSILVQQRPRQIRFCGKYDITGVPGLESVLLEDTLVRYRTSKANLPRLGQYNTSDHRIHPKKSTFLGQGAFGRVFAVAGTIPLTDAGDVISYKSKRQDPNNPRLIHPKQRVIKQQPRKNRLGMPIDSTREIKLSPTYLNMSEAIVTSKKHSVTLLKRISGKELFDVIDDDRNYKIPFNLTTKQLIEVTGRLLEALYVVHREGIVHRDLKPENIMVDITTTPISLKIIDFGLSKPGREVDKAVGGTPIYVAPETWNGENTTYAVDVFALSRIIGLMWGDADFNFIDNLPDVKVANTNPDFVGVKVANPSLKSALQTLLQGMARANPVDRLTLPQAQAQFLKILELQVVKDEGITAEEFSFPDANQQKIDKVTQSCFELIHALNLDYATENTPELNPYIREIKLAVNAESDIAVLKRIKNELSDKISDLEAEIFQLDVECRKKLDALLTLSTFSELHLVSPLFPLIDRARNMLDKMTLGQLVTLKERLTVAINCCEELQRLCPKIVETTLHKEDLFIDDYIKNQVKALVDGELDREKSENILQDIKVVSEAVNSIDVQAVKQVIVNLIEKPHRLQQRADEKAREIEAALLQTPLKERATMLSAGKPTLVKKALNKPRYFSMFKSGESDTTSMKEALEIKAHLEGNRNPTGGLEAGKK